MLRVRPVHSYRQMACRAGLEGTVNPPRPAMLLGVAAPVTVVSVAAATAAIAAASSVLVPGRYAAVQHAVPDD